MHRPSAGSVVLALVGLLGLAVLPPEHIHDPDGHGQGTELVHRHFEGHRPASASTHVDDDEDEEAHYLTAVFTESDRSFHGGRPDGVAVVAIAIAPLLRAPVVARDSPAALGHDPPWRSSLSPRAPPSPLV